MQYLVAPPPPTTVGGGLESVCLLEEMAEDRELEVSLQEMAIDAGKYMKLWILRSQ